MADTGMQLLLGLLSIVTAISLFAAAGFAHFIKSLVPDPKFAIIFPYLSMGSALLGLMMLIYAMIFFANRDVIAPVTSVLFFLGTFAFMLGAYKMTKEFGAQAGAQQK